MNYRKMKHLPALLSGFSSLLLVHASLGQDMTILQGKWVSVTPGPGLGEPVVFDKQPFGWDVVFPGVGLTSVRISDGTAGSNIQVQGSAGPCFYYVAVLGVSEMVWALRQGAAVCVQSADFKKILSGPVLENLQAAIKKQQGGEPLTNQQKLDSARTADRARATFTAIDARNSKKQFKVLWVDDQPANNASLFLAMETLGMVVVAAEDTDRIVEVFDQARGFDLVITDMFRDAVRGKPDRPTAGMDTVSLIKKQYPSVPVIIYSSSYATRHDEDALAAPVVAVTNSAERVINIVVDMARQRDLH